MLKTRFSNALLRLLCFVAFALCFGATANAQQNTITLSAPSAAERTEGNVQTFRLQLSRPATQRLTVRVATSEGTAFQTARPDGRPADYDGFSKDVTFDVGVTQIEVAVRTIGDNRYEFNETFNLTASNLRYNGNPVTTSQVVFSNNNSQTATVGSSILDDDPAPTLTLAAPNTTLEGNSIRNDAGTVTDAERTVVPIAVNIDFPAERPLTVAFDTSDNGTQPGSMSGTASAGQDYETITDNVVTIPENATQYIYQPGGTTTDPDPNAQGVVILGDDAYEGDEAFTLTVRYSPSLVNTTPSSTVIRIQDNDLPTYTITGGRAFEGSNIPFAVTLVDRNAQTVAAKSAITFNYVLDNISATFGNDYTNPSGTGQSGSFVIPIGSTNATVNIPILNDDIAENVETFNFRITSVSGALNADSNTATGTIDNLNGTPVISIADSSVIEGTNGVTNMVFTVSLSSSSTQQVTVQYETVDDTAVDAAQRATSGTDYAARTGTVIFPAVTGGVSNAANTTQKFSIPITTDRINERDENFRVRLFNPAGGSASFPSNPNNPNSANEIFATGTIIDDDPAGAISMATNNVSVVENITGAKVNVIVNFTPNGIPARPVTVNFTTIAGTALQTGQRDYFGKTGSITFQPRAGNASLAIPIEIINDDIYEGNETFTVRLTGVDGATLDTSSPSVTDTVVTIVNDEALPTVSVSPASPIREGGIKNFVVALNGKSQVPITVNYAFGAIGDTATKIADYNAIDGDRPLTGSKTFTPGGVISYFVPVQTVDDIISEGNETLSLVLSKNGNDTTFDLSPSASSSTVVIVDNDLIPELQIGDVQRVEGSTGDINSGEVLNFPVRLSRPSSRPVVFTYSTLNLRQDGCVPTNSCDVASDNDYASVRDQVVTIPAGATEATIVIRLAPDAGNEYNEQFSVVARALVNAVPSVTTNADNTDQRFGTTAFGTILNDDDGGVITITGPFTDATGTTASGNLIESYQRDATNLFVGNAGNFRVTLPTPANRPVTVNYVIEGSVDKDDISDITTGNGKNGILKGSVTFFPGDTTRNIVLRAVEDKKKEELETLRVRISIADTNGANSYTVNPNAATAATNVLDRTPSIASFAPATGFPAYGTVAATRVTINGQLLRTDGNPRVRSVNFGGVEIGAGSIEYTSDNSIVVSVPADAKSGAIVLRLTDNSNLTFSTNFIVQPTITSFTPTTGVAEVTKVTVTGTNFSDALNKVTKVRFSNNSEVDATVINNTQLQFTVPRSAATGTLRLVTANDTTGPASQTVFNVITVSTGSIAFRNPDLNPILEGSTGTFNNPVRNFDGATNSNPHVRYQLFINPAQQTSGANNGQVIAQTPLTITIQVTDTTTTGRNPKVIVLSNSTGIPLLQESDANGNVVVKIPANYNVANPLEIAIVDAGTDTEAPVIGTSGAAKVTVTARITQSDNPEYFPTTGTVNIPTAAVERREVVTNANRPFVVFPANTTDSFSIPYASGTTGSVSIADAFEKDQANGNYTIYRFDAANQRNNRTPRISDGTGGVTGDFVPLGASERLQRGIGYRIVTRTQEVRLRALGNNSQNISANTFSINLTRNIPFAAGASGAANATNGYNFIGFPFNNTLFSGVNFNNTTVTFNGTTTSLSAAAAAGLINSQLYTVGADGTLTAVTGTPVIEPFKAYFVQIFRDNLTINLNSPTQ